MRTVGIWASGLLASAIPFVLVGAVITFAACMFDAAGQHAPPARSGLSFQREAAPSEQALAVASVDAQNDVAQRQPAKHAYGDAHRHQHASPSPKSRSHSRVSHSSLVNAGIGLSLSIW